MQNYPDSMAKGETLLSPFMQYLDVTLEEWLANDITLRATLKDEFKNLHGTGHGGFILALLDTAISMAGIWTAAGQQEQRALTLSLNTQFLHPLSTEHCKIVGSVDKSGKSIFFSSGQVIDSNNVVIATAQGTFKRLYLNTQ